MIAALKAEIRKILTVRSTYAIVAFALLASAFICGFANGYKASVQQLQDPSVLQKSILVSAMICAIFAALVGILSLTHEYRYNTILYTLTANRSRTVALLAKIVAVTIFSILVTVLIAVTAPFFTLIGAQIAGHSMSAQQIWYSDIVWRVLLYGWGYAMIALLIATLMRNQVAAIVGLFIIPSTVESILTLLIKEKAAYLPFHLLSSIIDKTPAPAMQPSRASLWFLLYMVVGWVVAWALFMRRDAN
jgi:ABC-2 type transport system permease protein